MDSFLTASLISSDDGFSTPLIESHGFSKRGLLAHESLTDSTREDYWHMGSAVMLKFLFVSCHIYVLLHTVIFCRHTFSL